MNKRGCQSKVVEMAGKLAPVASQPVTESLCEATSEFIVAAAQTVPSISAETLGFDTGHAQSPSENDHAGTVRALGALLAKMVLRCAVEDAQKAARNREVVSFEAPIEKSLTVRVKEEVERLGPISPRQLAAILEVPLSSLGRALDALTRDGEISASGKTKARRYFGRAVPALTERQSA
jgi:hypothetical protein